VAKNFCPIHNEKDSNIMAQKGFVLWFTGLSGAGKTTLTEALVPQFKARGLKVEVLDGDEVRTNLSKGLGFSKEDRDTNIRRIGYVARLLARNGVASITAAISPYAEIRDEVRATVEGDGVKFVEVYVQASLDTLVSRDVKGLYKKAIAGEIKQFTGVSDPYEAPLNPEVQVSSDNQTVEQSAALIVAKLEALGLLSAATLSAKA
jgi:adenylylsulfate kinase